MRRKKTIDNPLRRRVLRELAGEWKKYLVIALFLIFMIGFVSGAYVANGSMLKAFDQSASRYRREDGNFVLDKQADSRLIDQLEKKESVTVYANPYKDLSESWSRSIKGSEKLSDKQREELEIRIFPLRKKINLPCVMRGRLPRKEGEIAIDRMHADNVGLKVGDSLKAGGRKFKITGLVSNPDYTTLFRKSTDMMFDALTFDVGLVKQESFDKLDASVHYAYSYLHTTEPGNGEIDRAKDKIEEKKRADDLVETLYTEAVMTGSSVEAFAPAFANQGIQFAPEDLGSDEAMAGVILYVLIAVMAFLFAITVSSTIMREAPVIGTLRATGFSRGQLIRHYMASPVIITLIAAVIGNILGYTLFKNLVVGMYYNSYGLPTFKTVMSAEALIRTTLIPVAIVFVINLFVIARRLRATPLQFLRRDFGKRRAGRAFPIPEFRFIRRFRLRVLLQNLPGYAVLFAGICFVMVMLAMAVGMPDSLAYYKDRAPEMMLAPYQTILKSDRDQTGKLLDTKEKSAEKFAVKTLLYEAFSREEEIEVYGMSEGSRYLDTSGFDGLKSDEVLVSRAFADKFMKEAGDSLRLRAQYENKTYRFKVAGVVPYEAGSSLFLPIASWRDAFDSGKDAFSGWLSDKKIRDVDRDLILNEVTAGEVIKMVDQLDHSLGGYMVYFQYLCIALSAILMFLLTKLIIDRNENPISMTKILGYSNREIASVYVSATTIAVIISEIIAAFVGYQVMIQVWKEVMRGMNGWFEFIITRQGIIRMLAFVFIGYLIVMFFDFRRIRRVPLDQALKNVE